MLLCEHIHLLTLHLTLKSHTPSDWLCSNTTSVHLLNSLQWSPRPLIISVYKPYNRSVSLITTAAPLQLLTTWGTFLRT